MEKNFRELVRNEIEAILLEKGVVLTQDRGNIVDFSSANIFLRFAFDPRERSSNLFLGPSKELSVLLDNEILEEVFGASEKIEQLPPVDFVHQVVSFLKNEGGAIVAGDSNDIRRLLEYQDARSRHDTAELVAKQTRIH